MKTILFLASLLSLISSILCHTISQRGLDLIKECEGFVATAYYDSIGDRWTIGYGQTSADANILGTTITQGMTITEETAEEWLELVVNERYGPNVDKFDNIYHWTQNEFDALCCFAYNLGSINGLVDNGNLPKSQIPSTMLQYVKGGGKVIQGLVNRRNKEVALYNNGNTGNTGNPVTPVTPVSNKKWLPPVTGYNKNDANNGYAGIMGRAITGLRVSGGLAYKVHIYGGRWLPAVTGNDPNDFNNGYAGTEKGDVIDAVAISGGVRYAVHIKGGNWLPVVTGYNVNDDNNGYAGVIGRSIDAIMINGRTYATSYNV